MADTAPVNVSLPNSKTLTSIIVTAANLRRSSVGEDAIEVAPTQRTYVYSDSTSEVGDVRVTREPNN
jgi:hypothetical protein